MYKYFCNSCGWRFESDQPERDEIGLLNDIACPHCGAWDVFQDTAEGSRKSIRETECYEATIELWNDRKENEP